MYLSGANKILTVDISNLIKEKNLKITMEKFIEFHESGKMKELLPHIQEERFAALKKIYSDTKNGAQTLEKMNISTIVCDARKLPQNDTQIDLITSNNTFEHIYPVILRDILIEFRRVVRHGGVQSHFIDMSDHFAHLDKSITIYNFLRFSDKKWKMIDNSVQPQNRLRISDYRNLYKDLDIPINKEEILPFDISALKKIELNEKYRNCPDDILAVSHVQMVSWMN